MRAAAAVKALGRVKDRHIAQRCDAGDKTFTSDSVTRYSERHIQRFVKYFDDDSSKRVLKPSLFAEPVGAAVAPSNRQKRPKEN